MNTKQDQISQGVGMAVGFGLCVALGASLGPWATILAVPPLVFANMYAARKASKALTFDNLSNGVVRSLVHQQLESGSEDVLSPIELKETGRKLPKDQPVLNVGANPTTMAKNPERLEEVMRHFAGENFIMDVVPGKKGLGEKVLHPGREARPEIDIVFREAATEADYVKGVYQGQVVAEILSSPGYAALKARVGEEQATLQVMDVASGLAKNFDQKLAKIGDTGWDLSRTKCLVGSWRGDPNLSPDATPVAFPQLNLADVRHFMEHGELPATAA